MKEDITNDTEASPIALILWILICIGLWVGYIHGLNMDQFIDILKALVWPLVIIVALKNDKVWLLINSFSDLEIPGMIKASRKAQQKPESYEEVASGSGQGTGGNEEEDFKDLDNFLVLNTRNALFWFVNQKEAITQDAYLQIYTLSNDVEGDVAREKHVIFSVLLHRGLVQMNQDNVIQVTPKGKRYLIHTGLLPNL